MTNTDKRSVSTDALETLGTIINEGVGRDAIHLAVEPVIAAMDLVPGEHVGFVEGGGVAGHADKLLGIVDPFLSRGPRKGEWFWLVVYPRQITSLRHVWSHPGFPESDVKVVLPADKAASEAWLRNFCADRDPSYEAVIDALNQKDISEHYWQSEIDDGSFFFSGSEAYGMIPDEFWVHAEIVTGRKMLHRPSHFSCSC